MNCMIFSGHWHIFVWNMLMKQCFARIAMNWSWFRIFETICNTVKIIQKKNDSSHSWISCNFSASQKAIRSCSDKQSSGGANNAMSKLIHIECQKVPDCEYHIKIELELENRVFLYPDDCSNYDTDDSKDYGTENSANSGCEQIFDYGSDESDDLDDYVYLYPISFYDQVAPNQEIELTKNLTIQCHSKNTYGHLIIKGFRFFQL